MKKARDVAPVITGETLVRQCGYYGIKPHFFFILSSCTSIPISIERASTRIYSVSFLLLMAATLSAFFFSGFFF